jgi:hypothetical protein
MTDNAKPKFQDILNLMNDLPDYPDFKTDQVEPLSYLQSWLSHHSHTLDVSKGFLVNRCALYWAGYDQTDGFDGKAFVETCQDSNGSLNQLASLWDTDLQIFELSPHNNDRPSIDEIAMATSYGMMGVEESTQLFSACSFGQGVEGASQNALDKITEFENLENFMANHCGLDHAAMMGAAIACIMKGIPIIIEGASGKLIKALIEKHTNKQFSNIIHMDLGYDLPGHSMIASAIYLKTLYAAAPKTDCGKIRQAA